MGSSMNLASCKHTDVNGGVSLVAFCFVSGRTLDSVSWIRFMGMALLISLNELEGSNIFTDLDWA